MIDVAAEHSGQIPLHRPGTQDPYLRQHEDAPLPHLIFASRWLQLPLYLGLIIAQGIYVWQFWVELVNLVGAAMGIAVDRAHPRKHRGARRGQAMTKSRETVTMLVVLGLIDVVMITNLLIMVIVGGYETFVSRMRLQDHPGPAGVALARQRERAQGQARDGDHRHLVDPPAATFINAASYDEKTLLWQTVIHITFLLSAMAIAAVDRLMPQGPARSSALKAHEAV